MSGAVQSEVRAVWPAKLYCWPTDDHAKVIASLAGDGVSILRNGKVGEIDRFTVYQSRNVLRQTSPAVSTYVPFGHSAGLTFAAQIVECQMIDNPSDFGYLIRGLMVYGYEVIEPSYVGLAIVAKAPAS